jgi:hypothetical protein
MARKSKKMFRSPKLARRQARKRRSQISERRKKEFLWRGSTLEDLKQMPLYPPDSVLVHPLGACGRRETLRVQ